jgi:CubicO group peptidase (beta-lactamase class C family)
VKKAVLFTALLLVGEAPAFGQVNAGAEATADAITQAASRGGFSGDVMASRGDVRLAVSIGVSGGKQSNIWRWASVTKQVIATLVMQDVAAGRIDLDKPVSTYLPAFKSPNAGKVTVRQLLRHQSGLPNPDDTAATPDALPAYYRPDYTGDRGPLTGYCAGPVKGEPGRSWSYNNCDYLVAGALLQAVDGKPWQRLVRERIVRPLKLRTLAAFPSKASTMHGFVDGRAEPSIAFDSFGAAAGLYGSVGDLWLFDRALLTGTLLPEVQRREMWDGQPKLGSIALGQWVFEAPLKGCAKPVRIVERRGALGGIQVRNFILPDNDTVVIAFANRAEFDFGEVWQGSGYSFDLLSAAACS